MAAEVAARKGSTEWGILYTSIQCEQNLQVQKAR